MDLNLFGVNDWLLFLMILLFYIVFRVVYCDCDFYFGGFGFVGGVCVYYC